MTQEEITQMFEGRWRIKSEALEDTEIRQWTGKHIKDLCRDFFETGVLLGEGANCQPIKMSTIVKAAEEVAFEKWWNLYQKKRGKEKCMKKWAKLSLEEKQACIDATPTYVSSTPDVIYRKDPLTYLNGKCWNDEVYFRTTPQQQQQQRLAEVAERIAGYTKAAK